jgi:F-type H+-transporting ATPase subunit a
MLGCESEEINLERRLDSFAASGWSCPWSPLLPGVVAHCPLTLDGAPSRPIGVRQLLDSDFTGVGWIPSVGKGALGVCAGLYCRLCHGTAGCFHTFANANAEEQMPITPDHIVYWHWGFAHLNATILFTWVVMLVLTIVSWLVTRRLDTPGFSRSRWENALEVVVQAIRKQIGEICSEQSDIYLPFIGTVFLFIGTSSLLALLPGCHPPTASLSTTAALAICVGVAVHVFGIWQRGFREYLRHYTQPTFLMLPFHMMTETSRTLALALRLFGNIMSESLILGVLLAIAPLVFPLIMQLFGLLMGMIQAYIFSVLATVYIAAAVQSQRLQKGATHA